MGSQVYGLKMLGEQMRSKAAGPFVEVPEHDPRAMETTIVQNMRAEQLAALSLPFEETCAQVNIKEMECSLGQFNIGAQTTTRLPPRCSDVVVLDGAEREPTQQQVPVGAAVEAAILPHAIVKTKLLGNKSRLVVFTASGNAQNFLKRNDVGIDFAQHFHDPRWANAAVESTALVDVVRHDPDLIVHSWFANNLMLSRVPGFHNP